MFSELNALEMQKYFALLRIISSRSLSAFLLESGAWKSKFIFQQQVFNWKCFARGSG